MQMQLVGELDIPQLKENQFLNLTPYDLKKLKKAKLINLECYVWLAMQITYGRKTSINIHLASFCDQWKLADHEMSLALAKLQKKGLLGSEPTQFIQIELFEPEDEY